MRGAVIFRLFEALRFAAYCFIHTLIYVRLNCTCIAIYTCAADNYMIFFNSVL